MSNLFSKNYFRVPNRSRSGDLDLQSGAAPVVRDRLIANSLPACLGHGEGQALALPYKGRCCGPVARGPVPRARRGRARQASVVRDRQIANRSGSGDPHLQRGSIDIKVLRTFSPCSYRTSIDIKVLTDLRPSFPNPANLVNPAHILPILKILLLISQK